MIKVALLTTQKNNWFYDTLFACKNITLYNLDSKPLGVNNHNPYNLEFCDKPDVVCITVQWFKHLQKEGKNSEKIFNDIRRNTNRIIGLNGVATFELDVSPLFLELVDIVLKPQGVFKDLELYNYKTGTIYKGGNWTTKTEARDNLYSPAMLEKLRLSVPCLIATCKQIRREARKKYSTPFKNAMYYLGDDFLSFYENLLRLATRKANSVHFIGALTHIQRYDLVRELKKHNLNGHYGITSVPSYIYGTDNPREVADTSEIRKVLTDNGLLVPKENRFLYKQRMLKNFVSYAICGYGELSFRQAEAWEAEALVVSQNLSHVQSMYPFKENENIVYAKPDLSDILEVTNKVLDNRDEYEKIAKQGRQDWNNWKEDWDKHLYNGIEKYMLN